MTQEVKIVNMRLLQVPTYDNQIVFLQLVLFVMFSASQVGHSSSVLSPEVKTLYQQRLG